MAPVQVLALFDRIILPARRRARTFSPWRIKASWTDQLAFARLISWPVFNQYRAARLKSLRVQNETANQLGLVKGLKILVQLPDLVAIIQENILPPSGKERFENGGNVQFYLGGSCWFVCNYPGRDNKALIVC